MLEIFDPADDTATEVPARSSLREDPFMLSDFDIDPVKKFPVRPERRRRQADTMIHKHPSAIRGRRVFSLPPAGQAALRAHAPPGHAHLPVSGAAPENPAHATPGMTAHHPAAN